MYAVGLTGGIGSGKSTVGELLVVRGAVLIDADLIAREVVAPDGPAYGPLVERFGPDVVSADGTIDRLALASVAFSDPEALAALNAITHPVIGVAMVQRREALRDTDSIVVLDIPLLRAAHRELLDLDAVVVVDCPPEISLERLVSQRNFTPQDAAARLAAQPSREDRLVGADLVVDNGADRSQLEAEVDRVWGELVGRKDAAPAEGPSPG